MAVSPVSPPPPRKKRIIKPQVTIPKHAPFPSTERFTYMGANTIPIDTIHAHPKNPRRGNLDVVRDSLRNNGQYRPVLVQQSTDTIIAGHHLWMAAKAENWTKIGFLYLDVDDAEALRIMLIDNRSSDLGAYDNEILAEVMATIGNPAGTGYSQDDFDIVIGAYNDAGLDAETIDDETIDAVEEVLAGSRRIMSSDRQAERRAALDMEEAASAARRGLAVADKEQQLSDEEEIALGMDEVSANLKGALALKEDMEFDGEPGDMWGIPVLRRDMLVESVPPDLNTWGDRTNTPDDGITTWLYNYGAVPSTGLPYERAILAFFSWDEKFECWWALPSTYCAKLMNSGITMAVVPDFSLYWDQKRALHLWNIYRAMWIGRYFQECGIRVLPRLRFTDLKSMDYCLLGIPEDAPVAVYGNQSLTEKVQAEIDGLQYFINRQKKMRQLVMYGKSHMMQDVMKKVKVPSTCEVIWLPTASNQRVGLRKAREKQEAIEAAKQKQKTAHRIV